jgi:photosystem II stability/assembly factor-like uncharacterized protein
MNTRWNKIILIAAFVLIAATIPAGAQDGWYAQSSGTSDPLFGVCFADADNGWAVGNGATILHTSNGGNTWSEQEFFPVSYLLDVHFADAMNGWAVGFAGNIRHTDDGGQNWTAQDSGTGYDINGVDAVDAMNAWIVGGVAPSTSNGSQFIRRTTDGGATWTHEFGESGYATFPLEAVSFANGNVGCAVGGGGAMGSTILFTIDGGDTWTPQSAGGLLTQLQDVCLIDPLTGWIVGRDGVILHTSDGGANWDQQTSPTATWLTGVSFVDANNGWASGGAVSDGVVLHTSDGGANWEIENSGEFDVFYDICFHDADNGWAVGFNGTIAHTSPIPPETVTTDLGCLPTSGQLPFNVTIQAELANITGFSRTVAGRMRVDLASGGSITNYRSGFTNVAPFSSFTTGWVQYLPALFALEGDNVFTLTATDVTAAPYNQPPYPASGDSDVDSCTVLGIVP